MENVCEQGSLNRTWKPVLMVCTEQEEWHCMHWRKNRRVSLFRIVSGDLEEKICVCKLQYLSPARVAGDVLLNVPPQYVLYVLLLKTTCSIILS